MVSVPLEVMGLPLTLIPVPAVAVTLVTVPVPFADTWLCNLPNAASNVSVDANAVLVPAIYPVIADDREIKALGLVALYGVNPSAVVIADEVNAADTCDAVWYPEGFVAA